MSLSVLILSLCLTACASSGSGRGYHYQTEQNPGQWKGKNISAVQQSWGSADQVFHTRSGMSYYLYSTNSSANFFRSTTNNFALAESSADFPYRGQTNLVCSAVFTTDKNGTIINTSHAGNNCGGEWTPN